MARKHKAVVAVIVGALALAVMYSTSAGATPSGNVGPNGRMTAEETRKYEAETEAWRGQVRRLTEASGGHASATEVAPGVTKILGTELTDITDEMLQTQDFDETAEEAIEFCRGKKELRIYLDDGSVEAYGPVDKMPKRVELINIEYAGKRGKVLFIEE